MNNEENQKYSSEILSILCSIKNMLEWCLKICYKKQIIVHLIFESQDHWLVYKY